MNLHRQLVRWSPICALALGACGSEVPNEPATPRPYVVYQVRDINAGVFSSDPLSLQGVNGRLFFTADDGLTGRELWVSDGEPARTHLAVDFYRDVEALGPSLLGSLGSILLFAGDDGSHGQELWRIGGTMEGTSLVKDIFPGRASSGPSGGCSLGGAFLFQACDGSHGCELWKTDGTDARVPCS